MRAAGITVGQEYACAVRGRSDEGPSVVRVLVLAGPNAGRVHVRVVAGWAAPSISDAPAPGTETVVTTRSLLSTWATWEQNGQARADGSSAAPPVVERLPELTAEDAVVQSLGHGKLLVLGNSDMVAGLGDPLYTLTPELTRAAGAELGNAFGGASAALQAASAVEGVRQAGLVFQVAESSVAQFRQLDAVLSNGQMLGVLRGDKGIQALVRWEQAGTGLRSLASVSGLIFTAAVIAGQAHMQKTQLAMCSALDNLKGMERDEQHARLRAARARVIKVVELACELGELTPALVAELPDRRELEVQLARAAWEVERHNQNLRRLPPKAADKLQVLQSTVPDVMFALAVYAEAEATLVVAEALHRHAVAQTDPATAAVLERYELRQRDERVAAGLALADAVTRAMKAVEAEPGGGWFAGGKRKQLRALTGQVRADLAGLRTPTPSAEQPLSSRCQLS